MQKIDCKNCSLLRVDHHGNCICDELQENIENIEWCPELENDDVESSDIAQ